MNIDQLNCNHGLDQQLLFKDGPTGMTIIEVCNSQATAVISLQGAQVLSWKPLNTDGSESEEVIWVSDDAKFAPGKSVRGGVPICWPWFGPHSSESDFPAHGFARTTHWHILSTEALHDGSTRITFTMNADESNQAMWLSDTSVQFQLTVGNKLEMELITHNNGNDDITIGQALHTYFNVSDVSTVFLHGLDDTPYLDKLENFARKQQYGPVTIDQEIDRIYLETANDCVIEDKGFNRNIIIVKCGSHSTVVWNPWQETAEKMGDLGENGYKQMLCVESANAAEDVVVIKPGKDHHLWIQYKVQPLSA